MPGEDIGPQLRMLRPRTSNGARLPSARPSTAEETVESGDYHIELLEYEWPDLPPINELKDAVTRQKVSTGISYLLPVDKGKNSINSRFRTDLRAMFQEPYATETSNYDDNRVTLSAKIHFRTNSVDTKWSRRHISTLPLRINSESEKVRRMYAHSAPAGGTRTREGTTSGEMRTRSNLILPIKSTAHPESIKLRKEVEDIIKSVQFDNDDYVSDKGMESPAMDDANGHGKEKDVKRKQSAYTRQSVIGSDLMSETNKTWKSEKSRFTALNFESYEQLKNTKPPKPRVPDMFKSKYLSDDKCQEIWEWLHYGEEMTDFQYFLTICG